MKITSQESQVVQTFGEVSTHEATISANQIHKLQYILTEGLYKDPISATIVEISNNAIDSIVESGKDPILNPVVVDIDQNKMTITDKGIGMDNIFFENVFMSLLESTKENSDEVIGFYGIGGKSWASLRKHVTFTIRKHGTEWKYLCYKGVKFIEYELLYEKYTTEENGVIFELPLTGYSEHYTFVAKAKQKLAYYDTVVLRINGKIWDNKIYRSDLFQLSNNRPYDNLHICLKDVVYTLDYTKLGIDPIPFPVALRFDLKSGITPTPSREDIMYSSSTIKLIKERINQVAEYLVDKYNSETKVFDKILPNFSSIYYKRGPIITIEGYDESLDIKCLSEHINKPLLEHGVSYFKHFTPSIFRNYFRSMLDGQFVQKAVYNNCVFSKNGTTLLNTSRSVIICEKPFTGNIKRYIIDKYQNLVVVSPKKRILRYSRYSDSYSFGDHLSMIMNSKNKHLWREIIMEHDKIVEDITSNWLKIEDIENSTEFIDWEENYTTGIKNKRRQEILNKKQIILNNEIEFRTSPTESKIHNQKSIQQTFGRKIVVYLSLKPESYRIIKGFGNKVKNVCFFAMRKDNIKLVENFSNFISWEKFMETKKFRQIVTAIRAEKLLEHHRNLTNLSNKNEFFKRLITNKANLISKIKDYRYMNTVLSGELADDLMEIAYTHNYFDPSIIGVIIEVEKLFEDFTFLKYLKLDFSSEKTSKESMRIVYQYMLFNKKMGRELEDFDISVELTPKVKETEQITVTEEIEGI